MHHSENAGPSEEAEADFAKELAKMFVEAPGENRRVDRKAIWEGPSLPTGVRKKRDEDDEVERNPGIVKFTVATRKGNKLQVSLSLYWARSLEFDHSLQSRHIPVPVETELVKQIRQSQLEDKAEQQQLKKIVLDYEQREDAEEQKGKHLQKIELLYSLHCTFPQLSKIPCATEVSRSASLDQHTPEDCFWSTSAVAWRIICHQS
jgi:regulator of nonsense transcripts 2